MVARMDADNDGKITKEELEKAYSVGPLATYGWLANLLKPGETTACAMRVRSADPMNTHSFKGSEPPPLPCEHLCSDLAVWANPVKRCKACVET